LALDPEEGAAVVYLLHFDPRYKHAGHYIGFSSDPYARLIDHLGGRGARLLQVVVDAGVKVSLVKIWRGSRALERRLKNRKEAPRLCPICRAAAGKKSGRGRIVARVYWEAFVSHPNNAR
jgi:predicted GIY-YIG superfamily endonuclease